MASHSIVPCYVETCGLRARRDTVEARASDQGDGFGGVESVAG